MGDRAAAVKFFNTALSAVNETGNPNRFTHAYQLFSSAALTDPTWHEGLFQAGNNCGDLEYKEAAVACFRRALECQSTDEERGKAMTNLGWKLHQLGHTQEALHWSRCATKLVPNMPYAWVNLSLVHQVLCDTKESLHCAQKAIEIAPDDPTVQAAHAFALLFDRRLASGLKAFECRFAYELKNFLQFPYPRWEGEEGKTVYLISDQGLGDTVSYARFVRQMCQRCKYVHAYVHPELMRAFTNAFVGITNLNLMPMSMPYPPADYWSTFISLPFALGLTDAEIRNAPPIDLPYYETPINWKVSDRKLHIGVQWAGSALNKIDTFRNFPVQMLYELYRVPGIQLYSLQVGPKAGELHETGGSPIVRDLVPYIRDVVDTASILRHLDFVIGCESALGHICSCVDMEFWMPYSTQGLDYRVGVDGTDRIWTPHHRVFKKHIGQTWDDVFKKIIEALRERVDAYDAKHKVASDERLGPRLVSSQ